MRESLGLVEPKKKARFKGVDEVVRIESRREYDPRFFETMFLTKRDRNRAMAEAFSEVIYAGGIEKWKSLEWVDAVVERGSDSDTASEGTLSPLSLPDAGNYHWTLGLP